MSEEKKEEGCCSSTSKSSGCGCGCGCGKGFKLLFMLLMAAFIFASGMWFAKAHCHACHMGGGSYCPFTPPVTTK